jgi:transposase
MKNAGRVLRSRCEFILNSFKAKMRFSSGIVQGLNDNARVITGKSYGFTSPEILDTDLYHALVNFPSLNWHMNSTDKAEKSS